MNTYDAAKVLSSVAAALRAAPNQSLEELSENKKSRIDAHSIDVPRALSMIVALSQFERNQWLQVAEDLNLTVDIRTRDASRDIMWKILRYLENDPEARKRVASGAVRQRSQTSPELAQALEILLKS